MSDKKLNKLNEEIDALSNAIFDLKDAIAHLSVCTSLPENRLLDGLIVDLIAQQKKLCDQLLEEDK